MGQFHTIMPCLHGRPIIAVRVFIVIAVLLLDQNIGFDLPAISARLVTPGDDIVLAEGVAGNPRPTRMPRFPGLRVGPRLVADDEMHAEPTALPVGLKFVFEVIDPPKALVPVAPSVRFAQFSLLIELPESLRVLPHGLERIVFQDDHVVPPVALTELKDGPRRVQPVHHEHPPALGEPAERLELAVLFRLLGGVGRILTKDAHEGKRQAIGTHQDGFENVDPIERLAMAVMLA